MIFDNENVYKYGKGMFPRVGSQWPSLQLPKLSYRSPATCHLEILVFQSSHNVISVKMEI